MAIRPSSYLLAPLALLLVQTASPALAQQAGYGQTIGTGGVTTPGLDSGSSRSSSILDSTNPIDLMNKLRRATALDDATTPGDAIDEALKAFDAQTPAAGPKGTPVGAGAHGTTVVTAPAAAVGPLAPVARP